MLKQLICWLKTRHASRAATGFDRVRLNAWVEENYLLSECKCGFKCRQLFSTIDYSHGLYKDRGVK